jgi:membrane-associated PAP2 superfamily phosphatase
VPRELRRDLLVILAVAVPLTLLIAGSGLDLAIAKRVMQRDHWWSEGTQNLWYTLYPVFLGSALAVAALLLPPLRARPTLRACAGVWLGTLLLANLTIIEFFRTTAGRPRPYQVTELGGDLAYRHPWQIPEEPLGESFPSAKAAHGFLFACLYFPLRRRHRGLAVAALGVGLAWGAAIGYGRMLRGSHFTTDILWSGTIVLLVAATVSRLRLDWSDP